MTDLRIVSLDSRAESITGIKQKYPDLWIQHTEDETSCSFYVGALYQVEEYPKFLIF